MNHIVKWVLLLGKLMMLVLVQALRLPMLLQLLLGCSVLLGHSGACSPPARMTAWGGASLLPAPVHEGRFAVVSEVQAEAPLRLGHAVPLMLAPCGHCKCSSQG